MLKAGANYNTCTISVVHCLTRQGQSDPAAPYSSSFSLLMFALMPSPFFDPVALHPRAMPRMRGAGRDLAPRSIFDAFDTMLDLSATTRALERAVSVRHNDDKSVQAVFDGLAKYDDIHVDVDRSVITIHAADDTSKVSRSVTIDAVIEHGDKVTATRQGDGSVVVTVPADALAPAREPKAITINVRTHTAQEPGVGQESTKPEAKGTAPGGACQPSHEATVPVVTKEGHGSHEPTMTPSVPSAAA